MREFDVHEVNYSYEPDLNTETLAIRGEWAGDEGWVGLMVQRSLEFDEQDKRLGQDTYCLVDEHQNTDDRDAAQAQPTSEPAGRAPEASPAPRSSPMTVDRPVILMAVAALVVIIGSFMPWAEVFGGFASKAGTSGDGAITLILGIVGILLALLLKRRRGGLIAQGLLAGVCTTIAIIDIDDVSRIDDTGIVSVGAGLYVTLVGAIAWIAIVIYVAVAQRSSARPPAPGGPT
jgi:hypothetical protein